MIVFTILRTNGCDTIAVLTGDMIRKLCNSDEPLISDAIDIDKQIQPNGIDLTIGKVELITDEGILDFNNDLRSLSKTRLLKPTIAIHVSDSCPLPQEVVKLMETPHWSLRPGTYLITFNELVNIPKNIMARTLPRSSLMRCGCYTVTAIWDAGYKGRSQALLVVSNPHGITLTVNARIAQMTFEELIYAVSQGYNGIYQNEGVAKCQTSK